MEGNTVFQELEGILGTEAANRLVDFYSGSILYIPKSIIVERTHRKIREAYRNGATYRELALEYGYAERYVRTIIHGRSGKHEQGRKPEEAGRNAGTYRGEKLSQGAGQVQRQDALLFEESELGGNLPEDPARTR